MYRHLFSQRRTELPWEINLRTRPILHIQRTPISIQQAINDLQIKLIDKGFLSQHTGIFDNDTKDAVMTFQEQHYLRIDGVVGPLTWAALCYPTLSLSYEISEDEKYFVIKLQRCLLDEGFRLKVNGKFNNETDRALRRFQRRYELRSDGICGPLTWITLSGQRLTPTQSTWSLGIIDRKIEHALEQTLTVFAIWIGITWNSIHYPQDEISHPAAIVVAYSLTAFGSLVLERLFPGIINTYERKPLLRYGPYVFVGLFWKQIITRILTIMSLTPSL